jgi:hypothetical protein
MVLLGSLVACLFPAGTKATNLNLSGALDDEAHHGVYR